MSVAKEFEGSLGAALDSLQTDEWALTKLREKLIDPLTPTEAFESIGEILAQAVEQTDQHKCIEWCWLAQAAISQSQTTEWPKGLVETLEKLEKKTEALGCQAELQPMKQWYRFANT